MDRRTIKVYDRTADGYEHGTADFWEKMPRPRFIEAFVVALDGPRVLDAGSGPGRDALMFHEYGLTPMCLDASAAMTRLSSKKGLPTVLGDFAHLPFRTAEFDGVWAYTSLLHTPKTRVGESLAEIHRVLKPGGIFGLGLLEGQGEEYRDVRNDGNPRWFSYYTTKEVHELLERSGFELMYSGKITLGVMTSLHFLARKT
jgi:ubiquinone/menaquinone biosynthesis C-methylase UbiE